MLLCPVCRENGVQRLRSCPWPLLESGRWGLEIGCWPHKLIIVTKIVIRNVKYESYLEEDCKESPWCSIRKQSIYHDHLGLNQPWSTQSVCGLRTSPGLWEDETVWGEGRGDTAEHLCHPRLQPWRQARATGLSTRARKAPRTASDSNQHLPSTQLSVSVPERLRDLGPHDGDQWKTKAQSRCNRYQSLQAILSSPNFHVHEQWEVVPDTCSTVCLSASAVLRGGQGTKLGEKHEELGSVPTWLPAGGTGAKDARVFSRSVPL